MIRAADMANLARRNASLQLLTDGGDIDATLDSNDATTLKGMLDAQVELTGVSSGKFDGKMQQTGVLLHVTSLANIQVLEGAKASPWSLPITPMDQILSGYHVLNTHAESSRTGDHHLLPARFSGRPAKRQPESLGHGQGPRRTAHRQRGRRHRHPRCT